MILEISDNILYIKDSLLEGAHISQLTFWGFKKIKDDVLIFNEINLDKTIIKLVNYFNKEKLVYHTSKEFEIRLAYLLEQENNFKNAKELGNNFKNGIFNKRNFKEFSFFINTQILRKLKPHQIKAAYHLYLIQNGANFSVPGSGKTSVVLSVYEKLKNEGKVNTLFVVGPPSCFGPWRTEFIETFGKKPNYRILAGGDRIIRKNEYFKNKENKAEMYLTTFQTLLNDQNEINTFFSQKGVGAYLVIDEAHYIKQIDGNWAKAVLNITKYSRFRCILTGTPIPNNFSDIYNLFDFLWPENDPIESKSRIKLQTFEQKNQFDKAKDLLDEKVGPLFYRVRKKDLGLKPAKFHDPIILKMNKYEQIIYDAIEKKIRNYTLNDYMLNIDYINRLKRGRMMRLRQSVSYVHLLLNSIENYDEDILEDERDLRYIVREYDSLEIPMKFEFLAKKVNELQNQKEKVVIWTNFVGTIEKLEIYIRDALGFNCRSIYGKIPIEQTSIKDELTREKIRDEFVNEKSGLDILLANPAACAESISLHKTCHNSIYYDLSYNCAQYLQSLDRIHRVGGSEKIVANYFFLHYGNSIDLDIMMSLRRKADKMAMIIDQDFGIYSLDLFDNEDELNAYDRIFHSK